MLQRKIKTVGIRGKGSEDYMEPQVAFIRKMIPTTQYATEPHNMGLSESLLTKITKSLINSKADKTVSKQILCGGI